MTSRLIEPRAISQIPSNCGPFHFKVHLELIFLQDTVHQQLFVLAVRIDMITFQLKTLRWTRCIRSCSWSFITYPEFSAARYTELPFEQVLRGSKLRFVASFSSIMLCFFFQVCWLFTAYTGLKYDKLWNRLPSDLRLAAVVVRTPFILFNNFIFTQGIGYLIIQLMWLNSVTGEYTVSK